MLDENERKFNIYVKIKIVRSKLLIRYEIDNNFLIGQVKKYTFGFGIKIVFINCIFLLL